MVFFIDTDLYNGSVFVVKNGVTTNAELAAAKQAGKAIFFDVDGNLLPMVNETATKFHGIIADQSVDVTLNASMEIVSAIIVYNPAYAKKTYVDSRLSNPNLLHNWHMARLINQRGKTTYEVGSGRYTIDRWRAPAYMLVEVVDGGVAITNESTTTGQTLVQYFESGAFPDPGETVTLSCLTMDGKLYYGTVEVPQYGGSNVTALTTDGGVQMRIYSASDDNFVRVALFAPVGKSEQIASLKAEVGDIQTLARQDDTGKWILMDPPMDAALETVKCQRYFQLFSSASARPSSPVDYRPTMRITPEVGTIVIDGTTYYYADANL